MLINTVPGILYLICFTAIAVGLKINIDKCPVTRVDGKWICTYNASQFYQIRCIEPSVVDYMTLSRYMNNSVISVFTAFYTKVVDYHPRTISVYQKFTEHQDGESWSCSTQTSKGPAEEILLFKLRDGLHSDKVTGITNGTVIGIAVGFCSLVSLLAVVGVVVRLKCVKETEPARRSLGGPPVPNMYSRSSVKKEDNYSCESIYDAPLDEYYDDAQAPRTYSNVSM